MPVHPELSSFTEDMAEIGRRNKKVIWKIKSTVAKITYKMFIKYSNPFCKVKNIPALQSFSANFKSKFLISLLESHL